MSVFVVTWDLNREKPNYPHARAAFVKQLDTYENTRDEGLDSVRFISTPSSVVQVEGYLRQKLDANDRLLVTRLNAGGHQGWLSKSVWEWINQRL
jgi:hypothetical protein